MWSTRPVTRILLFYITGILSVSYFPFIASIPAFLILLSASVLLIISLFLIKSRIQHKFNWITGAVLGLAITLSAAYITRNNTAEYNNCFKLQKSITTYGNIIGNPVEGEKTIKATLLIKELNNKDCSENKDQKVMCYFEKDDRSSNLKYGDVLLISSSLAIPSLPQNPYEFNYRNYLELNGTLYTSYIKKQNWKLIDYKPRSLLIAKSGIVRQSLLQILAKNGLKGDNYDVAAAILLGYDDGMEQELKQDFIMAGAMHILCVSGLHVGIIYLVINYLLSFLSATRINAILKAITLLCLVWIYAIITGLSPSVQRASIMISVFIIGNLLQRNRDTYNTLATSALILLLIDPQLLFNVGFQLSYAAVLGIITFHQPIYKLIYIKNSLGDKIWSITVLSFAAQLATFPIAMHYFHFFPPWFWLTNLVTFPLSFLIIVTGIVVLTVSWIPYVSILATTVLSWLVFALNYSVGIVKFLPVAGIKNIYMSLPLLFTIYLTIILTFLMISKKLIRLANPVSLLLLIIISLIAYHNYDILSNKKIVIYSINNHAVYEFIDGKNQIIIADNEIANNPSNSNYQISNSRASWGIGNNMISFPDKDTTIKQLITYKDNFITSGNLILYINRQKTNFNPMYEKLKVDIIIMSGNKSTDISYLLKIMTSEKIIIDPTVPPWDRKKIRKLCKESNIVYWDIKESGALVIDL